MKFASTLKMTLGSGNDTTNIPRALNEKPVSSACRPPHRARGPTDRAAADTCPRGSRWYHLSSRATRSRSPTSIARVPFGDEAADEAVEAEPLGPSGMPTGRIARTSRKKKLAAGSKASAAPTVSWTGTTVTSIAGLERAAVAERQRALAGERARDVDVDGDAAHLDPQTAVVVDRQPDDRSEIVTTPRSTRNSRSTSIQVDPAPARVPTTRSTCAERALDGPCAGIFDLEGDVVVHQPHGLVPRRRTRQVELQPDVAVAHAHRVAVVGGDVDADPLERRRVEPDGDGVVDDEALHRTAFARLDLVLDAVEHDRAAGDERHGDQRGGGERDQRHAELVEAADPGEQRRAEGRARPASGPLSRWARPSGSPLESHDSEKRVSPDCGSCVQRPVSVKTSVLASAPGPPLFGSKIADVGDRHVLAPPIR